MFAGRCCHVTTRVRETHFRMAKLSVHLLFLRVRLRRNSASSDVEANRRNCNKDALQLFPVNGFLGGRILIHPPWLKSPAPSPCEARAGRGRGEGLVPSNCRALLKSPP